MRLLPLFAVVLSAITVIAADEPEAKAVTDLFDISFSENEGGNCVGFSEATIQSWLAEALKLAKAGVDFVDAVNNEDDELHEPAIRLAESYWRMGEKDIEDGLYEDDLDLIKRWYNKMFNWLQNGGSVDDERDSSTPYFFCGDSWIIRQSMSDTLRRSDGEEAKNNKGELMKIIDDKDKVKIKETTAERYKNSKSTTYKDSDGNVKIYPYWSERLLSYIWAPLFGDPVTTGYCGDENTDLLGITFTSSSASGVPKSWISLCSQPSNIVLEEATCDPISDWEAWSTGVVPDGTGTISDVMPQSATFFHELVHLLFGEDLTRPDTPDGEEIYEIWQLVGMVPVGGSEDTFIDMEMAMDNPESFTAVAVAFYYTQNMGEAFGAYPVEYYSGYCTYHNPADWAAELQHVEEEYEDGDFDDDAGSGDDEE